MRCRKALKILNKAGWQHGVYSKDATLMDHLERCPKCAGLVRAETDLQIGIQSLKSAKIPDGISIQSLKAKTENAEASNSPQKVSPFYNIFGLGASQTIRNAAISFTVAVFITLTFIPFNFRDKTGYGISISGVDANIAMGNEGIVPLLGALGMEQDKVLILLNSLDKKEVHLKVGECSETCNLKISDLKTEQDVQRVIRAINELGCCEIDDVFPIFHDESSSLLGRATKKLFS